MTWGITDLVVEADTTIPLHSFPITDDKTLTGLETHIVIQEEAEAEDAGALGEMEEQDPWSQGEIHFTPTPWLKIHGSILSHYYGRAAQIPPAATRQAKPGFPIL